MKIHEHQSKEEDEDGNTEIKPASRCPEITCGFNLFGYCQTIPVLDWENQNNRRVTCKSFIKPRVEGVSQC